MMYSCFNPRPKHEYIMNTPVICELVAYSPIICEFICEFIAPFKEPIGSPLRSLYNYHSVALTRLILRTSNPAVPFRFLAPPGPDSHFCTPPNPFESYQNCTISLIGSWARFPILALSCEPLYRIISFILRLRWLLGRTVPALPANSLS